MWFEIDDYVGGVILVFIIHRVSYPFCDGFLRQKNSVENWWNTIRWEMGSRIERIVSVTRTINILDWQHLTIDLYDVYTLIRENNYFTLNVCYDYVCYASSAKLFTINCFETDENCYLKWDMVLDSLLIFLLLIKTNLDHKETRAVSYSGIDKFIWSFTPKCNGTFTYDVIPKSRFLKSTTQLCHQMKMTSYVNFF